MKNWMMAALLVAVISVSSLALVCGEPADGAGSDSHREVVSIQYDTTVNNYVTVTFDRDLGTILCNYWIADSRNVTQLHGLNGSSTNAFRLDAAKATDGYLAQDSYKMTHTLSTDAYLFDVYKITFNGNGTSLKSETAYISTDSLPSHTLPDGYIWNTKADKSGTWVTDLSQLDFTDNAATLYAFKGGKIGVNIESYTSTVTPGSDANVIVNLTGNSGISFIELNVEYDRTVLNLERAVSGNILTMEKPQVKNYPFNISFESNQDVSTVGNLFYMRFAVPSDAALGQYPIVITVVSAEDSSGKLVPYTIAGCAVTVAEKMRGDLNGNKMVDDPDAVVMKNALANIPTGLSDSEFDLNGDGEVNALDSLLLKKQLFGSTPVYFSDPEENEVTMTVSDGDGNSTVSDIYAGKTVYISAESSSVNATTSSGSSIAVTSVSDGRYRMVAPSENFTVKIS